MNTPADVYTVRALTDGELLTASTHTSEQIAAARFDSTVSYYRRSNPISDGVCVQLIDGDSVLYEQHVDTPAA